MKKKRFSIDQIVAVLKQAELGMPVADIIRQIGISEQKSLTALSCFTIGGVCIKRSVIKRPMSLRNVEMVLN